MSIAIYMDARRAARPLAAALLLASAWAPGLARAQEDAASEEDPEPELALEEAADRLEAPTDHGEAGAGSAPEEDPSPPSQTPPHSSGEGSDEGSAPAPASPVSSPERVDEPADQPVEGASPRGPALTFANSFFSYTNAVTAHTFSEAAQLSYDPTWQMGFALMPRFYLTDTTFLLVQQFLSLEVTDSNDGTYNREPLLSDTLLDLRQIFTVEGFVFQAQARLGFPLGKDSQAAGRILQTGLGFTVARPFPELAGFTVAISGAYRRWWATRNVPASSTPYAGNCGQLEPGAPPLCTQASGQSTARDILLGGLTLSVAPLPGFTITASGFYMALYGHELAPVDVAINGGNTNVADDSETHWRPFTYFSLAVAYDVTPWLNLQLGVQNAGIAAPLYSPDGSVRSPFSADTQVFLTTTIGLDSIYRELVGGGEDDGLTPEQRQRRRQGLASAGAGASF